MSDLRTAALRAQMALTLWSTGQDMDAVVLNNLIAELEAALAEPVQEPFGYLWPTGMHPEFRFTQQKRDGVDGMPLYTAPPQRKPLTEEEIHDCFQQRNKDKATERRLITRAVETAHGIK